MYDKLVKLLDKVVCAALVGVILLVSVSAITYKSDDYLRARVVKLVSARGSCTGEQVRAPSGKDVILSAGHCIGLIHDGVFTVIEESGKKSERKFIAEDPKSDLLLIEGIPGLKGLEVASKLAARQEVRTFTHGNGYDTYKTEGVVIQNEDVMIGGQPFANEEDMLNCLSKPKNDPLASLMTGMCVIAVTETVHTAKTVPGSSGGPVVDASGDLVGVVSAGNPDFNLMVTLKDIKAFLAKY